MIMKKAKFLSAFLAAAAMFSSVAAVHADDITIVVNGAVLQTETPAVIVNDRTLVPLRAISEALGCDVAWDSETRGITLTDGENLIFTWIGRDHAFKTSAVALEGSVVMEAPPEIMNDFTMVPLRAISEMFGAEVGWDGNTRTVTVNHTAASGVQSGLAEMFKTYEQVFDLRYTQYSNYVDGTGNNLTAEIQLEDGGIIDIELYPDIAPETVNNFVSLARAGHYDGTIFHRVISGFMIQGGGFDADRNRKTANTITGEFVQNGYFNLISHERGVISMARTAQSMDSASDQFFIVHEDSTFLDGQYAAFGKVISGQEYVDRISSVQTQTVAGFGEDVPVTNQVIKTVIIK